MSDRIKLVGELLTGAILRGCSCVAKSITLGGAKRVAISVISQRVRKNKEKNLTKTTLPMLLQFNVDVCLLEETNKTY
jgi:hypothetical protein